MITNALIPRGRHIERGRNYDAPSQACTGPAYLGRHVDWHAAYPASLVPTFEAAVARQAAGTPAW